MEFIIVLLHDQENTIHPALRGGCSMTYNYGLSFNLGVSAEQKLLHAYSFLPNLCSWLSILCSKFMSSDISAASVGEQGARLHHQVRINRNSKPRGGSSCSLKSLWTAVLVRRYRCDFLELQLARKLRWVVVWRGVGLIAPLLRYCTFYFFSVRLGQWIDDTHTFSCYFSLLFLFEQNKTVNWWNTHHWKC